MTIEPNGYKALQDENKQLKQDKESIYSIWKKAINRENNLIVENKQLKNDLKIKNDIIKNTLTIDRHETDDYINKLKQELFNAYLEIESDNVNIELSHYHIKKLLKIIDEHTLINPYTD